MPIEWLSKKCIATHNIWNTPVGLISRSKLKHKCIYKGKCPHRGYDLSQTISTYDINYGGDVKLCPLHGLKFDAETGELLIKL